MLYLVTTEFAVFLLRTDKNILLMKLHLKIILHAEGIPKTNKLTYTKTVDGHGKKIHFRYL